MAVRIEILEASRTTVKAALYFAVPLAMQQASAADNSRVPAGVALSGSEVVDLKAGKIVEVVRVIDATGFDTAAVRLALRDLWTTIKDDVLADYVGKYRWKGDYWTDAPAWVNV